MKRKGICLAVIVIALLTCGIIYFQPLSLSDIAGENDQVKVLYCELGVRNGEAYVDPVDYQDITPEQTRAVLALLGEHSYRRTVGTLFSKNGAVSGLGSETLSLYVYDDGSLIHRVTLTSSEQIVVNENVYRMKTAEQKQLMEQILEIIR